MLVPTTSVALLIPAISPQVLTPTPQGTWTTRLPLLKFRPLLAGVALASTCNFVTLWIWPAVENGSLATIVSQSYKEQVCTIFQVQSYCSLPFLILHYSLGRPRGCISSSSRHLCKCKDATLDRGTAMTPPSPRLAPINPTICAPVFTTQVPGSDYSHQSIFARLLHEKSPR